MKIILTEDIRKLGKKNELLEVKNGYGTYLINEKKAILATKTSLDKLKSDIANAKSEDERLRTQAIALKEQIKDVLFNLNIPYESKSLKLHGTITKKQLSSKLNEKYNMIESFELDMPSSISLAKTIYTAKLSLYKDIKTDIRFGVDVYE